MLYSDPVLDIEKEISVYWMNELHIDQNIHTMLEESIRKLVLQ